MKNLKFPKKIQCGVFSKSISHWINIFFPERKVNALYLERIAKFFEKSCNFLKRVLHLHLIIIGIVTPTGIRLPVRAVA